MGLRATDGQRTGRSSPSVWSGPVVHGFVTDRLCWKDRLSLDAVLQPLDGSLLRADPCHCADQRTDQSEP